MDMMLKILRNHHKFLFMIFLGYITFSSTTFSLAGPYIDKLSFSLIESTSEKDKKILMRWIVAVYASHPDLGLDQITSKLDNDKLDKDLAVLFKRLLLSDCSTEFKTATKYEGENAIVVASEFLGKTAAKELMKNSVVESRMNNFLKYLD